MRNLQGVYIASSAIVTGDVSCAPGVNIWYGAIIRGDIARIILEENVNIQDGCILHTDLGVPLTIEPGVVAGHAAVLHGIRIGQGSLIGIGARLLSRTIVGPECLIAAGSIVTEGMEIPARSVVMGIPGRIVRSVTDDDLNHIRTINLRYRELAQKYADGAIPFPYGS